MAYNDPQSGLPITAFEWSVVEPNVTLSSVITSPNGGSFTREMGTFNRLTEQTEMEQAIDDTRTGVE